MFVCPECGNAQEASGPCRVDATPVAAVGEDLLLGTAIGAYRVARLMGIGGMGRVYKGVHPTIGSRVAIKVLSRECSDRKDLVDRFFSEARSVNLIRHESIVNILDLATLPDGRPFIIMEYLDGAPLAGVVEASNQQRMPLPLGGLARLAAEVLDALGAAHAKGVTHRDLKPDNVFVTPNGRAKVLDFGIAKLDDLSVTKATATGSLLGTPHYMSPEQAAGKTVDHRADIYAMGVILFECATGQKPFVATSLFELLRQHVEVAPAPPTSIRADIPRDLEHVILVALAKQPDQRWSTAEAMSVALQTATAQLPPDQWAPILGTGVARTGAWSPTPPASWARSGRVSAPPTVTPPVVAPSTAPTVSAGQVTVASPPPVAPPSKRGLWMAAAAIVLLGGGVAVGVVASRGGNANQPVVAAAPTIPPSNEPPTVVAPPPTIIQPDVKTDPSAKSPDDGKSAEERAIDLVRQLPPEQQVELAPLIDLAKLSPEERKKRVVAIADKINKFKLGNLAPSLAPPSTPPEPPKDPEKWMVAHDLKGFAITARTDAAAFLRFAIAEARRVHPDVQIMRIDFDGVRTDGTADLTKKGGAFAIRFAAVGHAQKAPNECEFRIEAGPGDFEMRPIGACGEVLVKVPKCTVTSIWTKAIEKKPELASSGFPASITYYSSKGWGGIAYWYLDVKDADGKKLFGDRFTDDC